MEANELKIGNYVLFSDEVRIIDGFTHAVIKSEHRFDDYIIWLNYVNLKKVSVYIKEIEPIPLTEEWLLRFGFEKAAGQYFQNFCVLQYFDSELRLTTHQDHCLSIQIKFVHQLQNLYFALTGEELTLNN